MAKISGRLLKLEVDGTDHSDEASNASYNSAESDSDFVSFTAAASGGGRDYVLAMTLAQDAAAGTLWSEIYDNVGDTVPVVIAPYGNATATVQQPHFEANAIITEPDGVFIGGEANKSTSAVMTTEVEWPLTGRPVKVTA